LVAAVLGVVTNQKSNSNVNEIISTTTTPIVPITSTDKTSTSTSIIEKNLLDTINSTHLIFHLKHLQTIADNHNGTLALGTSGFKATLDYN
jgi:hypothetical protein